MNFRTNLLETLPSTWQVRHTFILDWYDGPREGFCRLSTPDCAFFFTLLGEWMNPDDLDDRLFLIGEVSKDAIDSIVNLLDEPVPQRHEHWVWSPRWEFKTIEQRQRAETHLEELISGVTPPYLVIRTPNMKEFLGVWNYHRRHKLRD
jgi:hypothetical protein